MNSEFTIVSQNLLRVNDKVRGAERLVDIEKGFEKIITEYPKTKLNIFVEGYAYGAKYQRESLAELGGVIRRFLYLRNLSFWVIPPTSLKLFVTGTGRAKKNFMKKRTKEKWGEAFKSDDVCDAYGLARLGMCTVKVLNGIQGYAHLEENEQRIIKDIVIHPELYRNKSTASVKGKRKANVRAKRKS